jgi:hypothetical protein
MTIPDPSYITVEEVEANTLIEALATLGEENITKLIQRAEDQIDTHVGQQKHHPDDENTDRVFPRENDFDPDTGTVLIPYLVSKAALSQVEWLYTQWWSTRTTTQPKANRDVTSESIGGDGSYSADYASEGKLFPEAMLCDQARAYLSGFVSRFVPLSVTDPDDVPPPT